MYSYLSTSRGDGNTFCEIMFGKSVKSIDTYLPREGPETSRYQRRLSLYRLCIATYLPLEGPETLVQYLVFVCGIRIDTYLPREGTETKSSNPFPFSIDRIDTYLPREGTENLLGKFYQPYSQLYRYLPTSRGAGNGTPSRVSAFFLPCV